MTTESDSNGTPSVGRFEATRDFLISDRRCTLRVTVIDSVVHLTFNAAGTDNISVGSLAGAIALDDLIPVTKAVSLALAGTAKALGLTASEYGAHIAKVQEDHPSAYGPWNTEQDERLIQRYTAGASLQELADEFGRTVGGIKSRIRWHNLPPRRAKVNRDDDPADDYVDLSAPEQDDDWQ